MRLIGSVLLAVAFAGLSATAQAGDVSLDGSWAGEMRQIDPDRESHYPVTMTLKGKSGTTAYPTLKCSGKLTRIAEAKSGYAIYQEKVTNDPGGTCIDGLVTMTTDAGKIVLGWFAAFEGTPSLASAVLVKDGK
jgi:hypothetical protein